MEKIGLLLLVIGLVACGGGQEIAEVVPTATTTIVPTMAVTETAVPTPTLTPTVEATEMPALSCDPTLLENAISTLKTFDSYHTNIAVLVTDVGTSRVVFSTKIDMLLQHENGDIQTMSLTMESGSDDNPQIVQIIALENELYSKAPNEDWKLIEGAMADGLLARFTNSELLKPELVESLTQGNCALTTENLVTTYNYTDVNLVDFIPRSEDATTPLTGGYESAEVVILFTEFEGVVYPLQVSLFIDTEMGEDSMRTVLTQNISEVNVPVKIEAPADVAPPTFFLILPELIDSEVISEGENFLILNTTMLKEDVEVFYHDYLLVKAWREESRMTESVEGIVFEVVNYENIGTGQGLAVGVGVQGEQTIVIITGGDNP
jgi:hypothetical protein